MHKSAILNEGDKTEFCLIKTETLNSVCGRANLICILHRTTKFLDPGSEELAESVAESAFSPYEE